MSRSLFIAAFIVTVAISLWAGTAFGYPAEPSQEQSQQVIYFSAVEIYVDEQFAGAIFTDTNGRAYYFPVHKLTDRLREIGGALSEIGRVGQFQQYTVPCDE